MEIQNSNSKESEKKKERSNNIKERDLSELTTSNPTLNITLAKKCLFDETVSDESTSEDVSYIQFSEDCIKSIEDPEFNIFKLKSEIGEENILNAITCYLFTSYGLYSFIQYDKLEAFLQCIESGYLKENPYHNELHAADVLQTCAVFLKWGQLKSKLRLTDIDVCSLLISCVIHDFKHPGKTNMFLINSNHPLAVKYNDISVLENFHVAESFKIINSKPDYNIFSLLSSSEYKIMRKRIIENVLATDMTFHTKQYSFLKLKMESFNIIKGINVDRIFENLDNNSIYNIQQEFMNITLHACDISNPTKPFHIYSEWATRVMNEFWQQGDREKELNLPVSFLCDRKTTTLPNAQVGFMDGLVGPFISVYIEFFPELSFLKDNLDKNKALYKKIKEEDEAKAKETNINV